MNEEENWDTSATTEGQRADHERRENSRRMAMEDNISDAYKRADYRERMDPPEVTVTRLDTDKETIEI